MLASALSQDNLERTHISITKFSNRTRLDGHHIYQSNSLSRKTVSMPVPYLALLVLGIFIAATAAEIYMFLNCSWLKNRACTVPNRCNSLF